MAQNPTTKTVAKHINEKKNNLNLINYDYTNTPEIGTQII